MSKTHHEHIHVYCNKTKKWKKKRKKGVANLAKWPLHCESLAVHPELIPEAEQQAREHGVPTEFTPDGTPVMTGPGHYRQYRKLRGVHFNNGYES